MSVSTAPADATAVTLISVTSYSLTLLHGGREHEVVLDFDPGCDNYHGPFWAGGGDGDDAEVVAAIDALDERQLINAIADLWRQDPECETRPIVLRPLVVAEAA